MNFEGVPLTNSDSANLQAQIDAINIQITTVNSEIKTIQDDLKDVETELAAVQEQVTALSDSAIGWFTEFSFTSTTLTDVTLLMAPTVGTGMYIPFSHMRDGMAVEITVFCAMINDTAQDFRFFVTQDSKADYGYTFSGYEAQIVRPVANALFWKFIIMIPDLGTNSVFSCTTTGQGNIYKGDVVVQDFATVGGLPLYFWLQWRVGTGAYNFAIDNVLIERVAGFVA